MADSTLARQHTVLGRDREAIDAWTRVVTSGGVVVWTATLYDVDYKSHFLMAFGREAVRIYRVGQFTGPIDRRFGYVKFPEPTEVAFNILAERNPDFDPWWDDESEAFKNVRGIGLGPWEYNRRLRDMILRLAEPQNHIKRTSAGRGAGW